MRCGESVPALVALWCAGKRLLLSLSCDRSQHRHDISCIGSSEKIVRFCVERVRGACAKLGSGAMGSRFREQLTHWTDAAVFTQRDQWKGYLSAMVTAHEAGLLYTRNFLEEITKNKYNQGGLTQ